MATMSVPTQSVGTLGFPGWHPRSTDRSQQGLVALGPAV